MTRRRICEFISRCLVLGLAAGPAYGLAKGDINDDGSIDPADIAPFIAVVLGQNTDPTAICAADVNSNGDTDADDIPSFVEAVLCGCGCTQPSDCGLGEDCVGGLCQPAGILGMDLSDASAPCDTGPNRPLEDGDVLSLCGSFSGFTLLNLTIRLAGFDPGATVDLSYSIHYLNPQACTQTPDCPPGGQFCRHDTCVIGGVDVVGFGTTDTGCGVNEIEFVDVFFVGPAALDGQDAILSVTVTDSNNPSITVSKTVQVVLGARLFCFFQANCPPDHTCIGNYCMPD